LGSFFSQGLAVSIHNHRGKAMDSKRSRSSETGSSAKADNFKLIKGVSGKVELRLRQAGILTYTQFASLSPEDLITIVGDLSGLTVEKIIRQDWTGQARELALRPKSDEPAEGAPPKDNGERVATFVTEMSLNANNDIISTHVRHVQSGDEMRWGRWREDQFIKFFIEHANPRAAQTSVNQEAEKSEVPPPVSPSEMPPLEQTEVEADSSETPAEPIRDAQKTEHAPEPYHASPAIAEIATKTASDVSKARTEIATKVMTEIAGKPRASKLEVVAAGSDLPSMLVRHDQPFNLRFSLDLSNVAAGREEPLAYTAVVHARSLSDKRAQSFSRTSGRISPSDNTVIKLSGIGLRPGSYRLGVDVMIHQPRAGSSPAPYFHIQTETAVLRVY